MIRLPPRPTLLPYTTLFRSAGTGTTMLVADQPVGVAAVPLNVTVLVPLVAPKLVPVIVTAVATGPLVGERLVRVGGTDPMNTRLNSTHAHTSTTAFSFIKTT